MNTGGFSIPVSPVEKRMAKIASIKENYLFSKAYAKGKRQAAKNLTVYVLPNYKTAETKLGITVSKKLGGAVSRTRARRLIREAFRLLAVEKKFSRPYLIVVVGRSALMEKNRKMWEVKDDLSFAFQKLGVISENQA